MCSESRDLATSSIATPVIGNLKPVIGNPPYLTRHYPFPVIGNLRLPFALHPPTPRHSARLAVRSTDGRRGRGCRCRSTIQRLRFQWQRCGLRPQLILTATAPIPMATKIAADMLPIEWACKFLKTITAIPLFLILLFLLLSPFDLCSKYLRRGTWAWISGRCLTQ